MLDYTGSSPIATVVADLASGKITDTAITIHAGPGAMALGWHDTGSQIDILPTLVGDMNLNGAIDNNDLGEFLKYFNHPGGWAQGDFNYNWVVNNSDLGALLANFNWPPRPIPPPIPPMPPMPPLVVGGVNAVPEPSSLIMLATLLALGGTWTIGRRQKRTSR